MLEDLFFDIERLGYPSELQGVPWVISILWVLFFAEKVRLIDLPNLRPRGDVIGIVTTHFGHGNLPHIISNSIGLAIFLSLYLVFSEADYAGIAIMALAASGVYWLIGRGNVQTRGASAVVYALAAWWLVYCVVAGQLGWFVLSAVILISRGFFDAMDLSVAKDTHVDVFGHFLGFASGIGWALWSFHKAGRI